MYAQSWHLLIFCLFFVFINSDFDLLSKVGICGPMHFASFLSGGFTTMAVINPPYWKLTNRTSVQWSEWEAANQLAQIVKKVKKGCEFSVMLLTENELIVSQTEADA